MNEEKIQMYVDRWRKDSGQWASPSFIFKGRDSTNVIGMNENYTPRTPRGLGVGGGLEIKMPSRLTQFCVLI